MREWPTFAAIAACYGVWFGAGIWLYALWPWLAIPMMALAVAFHSSLQHEAIHGHPTRVAWINEWLVGLPIGVFYPYRRYRAMHLQHHNNSRLTDPEKDPESFYHDPAQWARTGRLQRAILSVNNTISGRIILGPGIGRVRFALSDLRRIRAGERDVFFSWSLHAATLVLMLVLVTPRFHMPLWLYVLGPAYGGTALIGLRSFCEHRWHENPHARTIIVERSWLSLLFLNNNLHVVHHARPRLPWFRLPAVYRAERKMWQGLHGGYVYRGYASILWLYFWRSKEPLAHPGHDAAGPF